MMEAIGKMKELIIDTENELNKLYEGKTASSVNARKHLLDVKNEAHNLRKTIITYSKHNKKKVSLLGKDLKIPEAPVLIRQTEDQETVVIDVSKP